MAEAADRTRYGCLASRRPQEADDLAANSFVMIGKVDNVGTKRIVAAPMPDALSEGVEFLVDHLRDVC